MVMGRIPVFITGCRKWMKRLWAKKEPYVFAIFQPHDRFVSCLSWPRSIFSSCSEEHLRKLEQIEPVGFVGFLKGNKGGLLVLNVQCCVLHHIPFCPYLSVQKPQPPLPYCIFTHLLPTIVGIAGKWVWWTGSRPKTAFTLCIWVQLWAWRVIVWHHVCEALVISGAWAEQKGCLGRRLSLRWGWTMREEVVVDACAIVITLVLWKSRTLIRDDFYTTLQLSNFEHAF